VAQINHLLAGNRGASASYLINSDTPPGSDTLTLLVDDQGNTGSGGPLSDSVGSTINITAVNDSPTASAPASYNAAEQVSLTLHGTGLSIADIDAAGGNVQVTLSVVSGTLTVTDGTTGVTVAGSGSNSVTLTGTVVQINNLLAGNLGATASYLINSNEPPATDTLTLLVDDQGNTGSGGPQSDLASSTINITAVNDAPVNNIPGSQSTSENTALVLSAAGGNQVSISDPDAGSNPVQITLTAANGVVTLNATAGLSFSAGDGTADATMIFTGTLADVNAALDGMSFLPTPSYSGPASLQIITDDLGNTGAGGALTDTDTIGIVVGAVNDAPVNNVPAAQATNEDTPLIFSAAGGNSISVSDLDAGLNPLQITLTATGGTLTLGGGAGLTFVAGDGTADAAMTFVGTLAEINAALDGMAFLPNANYSGAASLQITSDDQGNTGSGGALADTDTVNITVGAVNDAPALALPGMQAPSSTTVIFSTAGNNAITVSDVDSAGMPLRLTLTAANGTLTLASTAGLVLVSGTGVQDASVQLVGDLASINAALDGLRMELGMSTGPAALGVTVDDQGATGQGGPQVAAGSIPVQQLPLIAPPAPSDSQDSDSDTESNSEADSTSTVLPGAVIPRLSGPDESAASVGVDSPRQRERSHQSGSLELAQVAVATLLAPAEEEPAFAEDLTDNAAVMDRFSTAAGLGASGLQRDLASLDVALLWDQLDTLADEILPSGSATTFTIGTAAGVSAVFSAGYVAWCLRSGALLASAISALPMWRTFDPLPVLEFWEKRARRRGRTDKDQPEQEEDSVETLVEELA
jgi:hypothetical protein